MLTISADGNALAAIPGASFLAVDQFGCDNTQTLDSVTPTRASTPLPIVWVFIASAKQETNWTCGRRASAEVPEIPTGAAAGPKGFHTVTATDSHGATMSTADLDLP